MAAKSFIASVAALAIVTLLSVPHVSAGSCSEEAAAIQSGSCWSLFNVINPIAINYAGASCPTVNGKITALLAAGVRVTDACCTQLRSFLANGCACDADVYTIATLTGYTADQAPTVLSGTAALAQASPCSAAKYGGPLVDQCTGSTGCPIPSSPSSRRLAM